MAVRSYVWRGVLKVSVAGTGVLLVPARASAVTGVKATQVTSVLSCTSLVAEAGG